MLHLIRGLPGSGKTTFARSETFGGMLLIERDQFWLTADGKYKFRENDYQKAIDYQAHMVEEALKMHVNTVVTGVFMHEKSVKEYIDLAAKYQSAIMIWRCTGKFHTEHAVPEDKLKWMADNFEELHWPENIVELGPKYVITKTTNPTKEKIDERPSNDSTPLPGQRNGESHS